MQTTYGSYCARVTTTIAQFPLPLAAALRIGRCRITWTSGNRLRLPSCFTSLHSIFLPCDRHVRPLLGRPAAGGVRQHQVRAAPQHGGLQHRLQPGRVVHGRGLVPGTFRHVELENICLFIDGASPYHLLGWSHCCCSQIGQCPTGTRSVGATCSTCCTAAGTERLPKPRP